jgi:hypothetical protein
VVAQAARRRAGKRLRKNFFFEKKKQKTFVNLASASPDKLSPA